MRPLRLCSILARKGSKGLKNKNIRSFCGQPLIAHVIAIAKKVPFDGYAVSSDSQEILDIAKAHGVDFLIQRPASMATDAAPKLPAIQHCAKCVEEQSGYVFSTFVDLAVTAPLMLAEDIIQAIDLLEQNHAENVITGTPSGHSPYFSVVEPKMDGYMQLVKNIEKPFERRQDCPRTYDMNGAIYVWGRSAFFSATKVITAKTLLYEMPKVRSVDIDDALDFAYAEFLYKKRKEEVNLGTNTIW